MDCMYSPWGCKELDTTEQLSLFKNINSRTSLVVWWLRLCTPYAGSPGSIPGQGTGPHMPQLKIPCVVSKTQCSQTNKYFEKLKNQFSIKIKWKCSSGLKMKQSRVSLEKIDKQEF